MNTKIYWNHLSHAQSHSYGRKIFHHFRNVSVFFILRVRPPNSSSMNNTKAFFSFLVRGRKYCCCILILCFAWVLDTKRKRVPPSGIRAFIIICSFISLQIAVYIRCLHPTLQSAFSETFQWMAAIVSMDDWTDVSRKFLTNGNASHTNQKIPMEAWLSVNALEMHISNLRPSFFFDYRRSTQQQQQQQKHSISAMHNGL